MSEARRQTRVFVAEFIELYKAHPCLWRVKSKDYTNRHLKSKAYDVLVQKFREVDENAGRKTVVRKINALRSCLRKELKKVTASRESGPGVEVYTPNLWYFDLLQFLRDQDTSDDAVSNSCIADGQDTQYEDDIISRSSPSTPRTLSEDTRPNHYENETSTSSVRNGLSARWKPYHSSSPSAQSQDHLDYAAKTWAATIRTVPRDQQIYALRMINEVMFEAQMGNLNRNSYIICAQTEKSPQPMARDPWPAWGRGLQEQVDIKKSPQGDTSPQENL